jgi:hypothetical protein
VVLEDNHYLFRLRAACVLQPEWNTHQLAALDHLYELAHRAATIEEFLLESKDLLELARAASLDRAANLLASALRTDQPWLAAAAASEYRQFFAAGTHAEMYAATQAGQRSAAGLRECAVLWSSSVERLLHGLLILHTASNVPPELEFDIQNCFEVLLDLDANFRPGIWLSQPRYRWRIPWSTAVVEEWLEPYWPKKLPSSREVPVADISGPKAEWLSQLHHCNAKWPSVEPLPLEPMPGGADFPRHWPDANLARHADATQAAIAQAATAIAREGISVERSLDFQMEAVWNQLLLASLLAPLRAAVFHELAPDGESEAGLTRAIQTTHALTGFGPRSLLGLPRVKDFLEHNFKSRLQMGLEGFGAMHGEAGFDLIQHALALNPQGGKVDFEKLLPAEEPACVDWPILHRGVAARLKGPDEES